MMDPPAAPGTGPHPPWVQAALARLAEAQGTPRAAFFQGAAAWLGHGCAGRASASGPRRFRRLRQEAQRILDTACGGTEEEASGGPAPRMVGGAAFHAGHAASGPWKTFPSALLWLPENQAWCSKEGVIAVRSRIQETAQGPPSASGPDPCAHGAPLLAEDEDAWTRRAARLVRGLDSNGLRKVVLARCRQAACAPVDPVRLLARLVSSEPSATAFLLEPEPGHALVGATPETLVHLQGGRLRTHALAGSAPRGLRADTDRRLAQALLGGAKEAREHAPVVRHLRSRMRRLQATRLQAGTPQVVRLATVQHLETPLTAQAPPGLHVLDAVAAFHPTPAVAGDPPGRARRLLETAEPFPRGWYAGPVGWIDPSGHGAFHVALRCALAGPDGVWSFAGAGLVPGSDPASEWRETQAKADLVERAVAEAAS